jgi:hypothetical protein
VRISEERQGGRDGAGLRCVDSTCGGRSVPVNGECGKGRRLTSVIASAPCPAPRRKPPADRRHLIPFRSCRTYDGAIAGLRHLQGSTKTETLVRGSYGSGVRENKERTTRVGPSRGHCRAHISHPHKQAAPRRKIDARGALLTESAKGDGGSMCATQHGTLTVCSEDKGAAALGARVDARRTCGRHQDGLQRGAERKRKGER